MAHIESTLPGNNISILEDYVKIDNLIINEIPIGLINGINSIFQTLNPLLPDSEEVYVNGQKQFKPNDYNISGQNVTLTFSPSINEVITINYIKQ